MHMPPACADMIRIPSPKAEKDTPSAGRGVHRPMSEVLLLLYDCNYQGMTRRIHPIAAERDEKQYQEFVMSERYLLLRYVDRFISLSTVTENKAIRTSSRIHATRKKPTTLSKKCTIKSFESK